MISRILFFFFPLLLILLPIFLYKNDKTGIMAIWYRLAFDKYSMKMAANLLALVVIFFNLTYFAVFSNDIGILVSTVIMFFLFSVRKSVKAILTIRRNKYLYITLASVTILILFIPHTLSTAYTLGAIIECASIFPATGLENFYNKNLEDEKLGKQFMDAYFH